MSNLIGCKVLVYPTNGNNPYEAIVLASEQLANGIIWITEVAPIKNPKQVVKITREVVNFISSPFGKQVFDWLARLFDFKGRKQRRKNQAPRF